jgi:hypothetical protein
MLCQAVRQVNFMCYGINKYKKINLATLKSLPEIESMSEPLPILEKLYQPQGLKGLFKWLLNVFLSRYSERQTPRQDQTCKRCTKGNGLTENKKWAGGDWRAERPQRRFDPSKWERLSNEEGGFNQSHLAHQRVTNLMEVGLSCPVTGWKQPKRSVISMWIRY